MNTIQVARRFTPEKWGGTETVILETSKRLRERRQEVEIWSSDALSEPGVDAMAGVPVRRFPYVYPYLGLSTGAREQLDLKGGNLVSFDLYRALRSRSDVDLIHLHTGKRLGGLCRTAALKHGVPYVVSLHGGVFDVPQQEAASWTEPTTGSLEWGRAVGWWYGSRRVLTDADAVICVGQEEARLASERLPDTRVEYLPNGVDSRRFATGDGERFRQRWGIDRIRRVLLVVGRIDPQKNQLMAVELLQTLLRDDPTWHLVLAGPTTDRCYGQQVNAAIRECGLESRVTLTGPLEAGSQELRDAYHGADLFLLPSRHEPFGIVALEAWAAGLPVVASNVGGLGVLVQDGIDGRLVDLENRGGWVRAVRCLSGSPGVRRALAGRARERCRKEFDWQVITDRLVALYEELSTERRSSAHLQRMVG